MYPTLPHAGTFVLHSALSLRLNPLDRGNLVTAVSPLDPSHQVLKRVIGLPGDTVCVDPSGERGRVAEWCKVPPGHVWLAGDNTSNSTDSRDYGPVPIAMIRGRVLAKVSSNCSSFLRENAKLTGAFMQTDLAKSRLVAEHFPSSVVGSEVAYSSM